MKPLTTSQLYRACKARDLNFKSTKSLQPLDEIVGQERAQEAIRFAMAMKDSGYNIYAVGRNGLGKRTMMLRYLNRHASEEAQTWDWCYVANFDEPRSPTILKLPAGVGMPFKKELEKLMLRVVKAIPQAFDNDSYYERSEKLKTEISDKQEEALERLAKHARSKKVSLTISTPGGYRLVALNGKEPHTAESFAALSEEQQAYFEETINKLEKKLRAVIRKLAAWEQEHSDRLQQLNEEVALGACSHLIEAVQEKYQGNENIVGYLVRLQKDILNNLDIFLEDSEEQAAFAYASLDKKMPRRYQVNVLVHQAGSNSPIVVEENPTYHNLFGYVENVTYKGTVFTDYTLIRPGALHRANGGYLLMDAIKVLEQPFVWDGLKRALRSRTISINSLERELTLSGTISLEPEAIPLSVKIILFGDRDTLLLLQHYDPEFKELFKVTADFESEMPRTFTTEQHYAKFISSLVADKGLLHCEQKAVARVIEYSSRQAEDQNKLSLHAADIANLLRESNYWAKQSNSTMIRQAHIEKALESERHRNSRIRDQLFETISNGTTLLDTRGEVIGQINALSVLSSGGFEFGMPNRVTANCFYGDGAVIDIERDVKLGGTIHSKGVMILSSYLAATFSAKAPLHLSASITFEQNYGEVDGDSASMAELCALLSTMAKVPIRQDFAMTGSVNQFGESQPVGGVNEKIEGFFETCKIHGFTGTQGIILPHTNIHNLMLNAEVLEAVEKGTFHIYAIRHVSEAIELLMGLPAGVADEEGNFPEDSLYGKIQGLLEELRAEEEGEEEEATSETHASPDDTPAAPAPKLPEGPREVMPPIEQRFRKQLKRLR
ncbi:MAG: AAA family ATPase [Hahellaceae bacterium]|nr:AAA family ATPase [Hahellaceae bacterium]